MINEYTHICMYKLDNVRHVWRAWATTTKVSCYWAINWTCLVFLTIIEENAVLYGSHFQTAQTCLCEPHKCWLGNHKRSALLNTSNTMYSTKNPYFVCWVKRDIQSQLAAVCEQPNCTGLSQLNDRCIITNMLSVLVPTRSQWHCDINQECTRTWHTSLNGSLFWVDALCHHDSGSGHRKGWGGGGSGVALCWSIGHFERGSIYNLVMHLPHRRAEGQAFTVQSITTCNTSLICTPPCHQRTVIDHLNLWRGLKYCTLGALT